MKDEMVSDCGGGGLSNLPTVVSWMSHQRTTNAESVCEREVRIAEIIVQRAICEGEV